MAPSELDSVNFGLDEACAHELDAHDELAAFRERFLIPRRPDGRPVIYLAGNSLGLQPRDVRGAIEQELADWANLAVDGHFHARTPWYSYHQAVRDSAARLVGAQPDEVVMMNGLTANLHLLMVSFYRPRGQRRKVLMEEGAFPSDTYAVQSQMTWRGIDPREALLTAHPRPGEQTLRTEDLLALIEREGPSLALVLLGGVNYYTGQVFDMPAITAAAHAQGALAGFDLAHAAGNVLMRLHEWGVDFAAWCSYKYLNSGPGSVAGAFIHERHARDASLPRFAGWWGNDPATRFRMHLNEVFVPVASADAWQLSNPPILSLAAVKASLALFDEAGMDRLRAKSLKLTGYLQFLLDHLPSERYEVITPRAPEARGAQLSILAHHDPSGLQSALHAAGVVSDFRPPNVVRVAPVPLYNTFQEVWSFAQILRRHV